MVKDFIAFTGGSSINSPETLGAGVNLPELLWSLEMF